MTDFQRSAAEFANSRAIFKSWILSCASFGDLSSRLENESFSATALGISDVLSRKCFVSCSARVSGRLSISTEVSVTRV